MPKGKAPLTTPLAADNLEQLLSNTISHASGDNAQAQSEQQQETTLDHLCQHYLHYESSYIVHSMTVLLSNPDCQTNAYNAHGDTPLLQWIHTTPEPMHLKPDQMKSAEFLLDILIAHGANLEAKDTVKHETTLDKTLQDEKLYWFVKLVEKGAGIHANGELIARFLQHNQRRVRKDPALHQCIAKLKQRNLMLRWLLSQSIWEKQPSPTADMAVTGLYTGEVYLPKPIQEIVSTAEQQFNSGGKDEKPYMRRVVQAIQYQRAKWHIKKDPEMPGMEKAVQLFSELLFGQHTAPHELFAFFDSERNPYPVLISQTIPGENFHNLLRQYAPYNKSAASSSHAEQELLNGILRRLHPQYLSEQLITAMLIHPEDGKPENYQVIAVDPANPQSQYRIIGIDNDHAFVQPVKEYIVQVKCVLFCLDEMSQPVHPAVRERLLAISPRNFLCDWLMELVEYQNRVNQLFDVTARKRLLEESNTLKVLFGFEQERLPVILTIPFRHQAITEILDRFTRLQYYLRKYPFINHQDLLIKLERDIGSCYSSALSYYERKYYDSSFPSWYWCKEPHDVEKRFRTIAYHHYGIADVAGHYKTLTTSLSVAKQMGLSEQELDKLYTDEGSQALGPEEALKELTCAIQEKEDYQEFMAQLLEGNVSPLHDLLSQPIKELLINQIPFEKITLANSKKPDLLKQQKILAAIIGEKIAFQRLSIKNCAALTDEHMMQLLRRSPNLTHLTLSNCPNITYKTTVSIGEYNFQLRSLILQQLPNLVAVGINRLLTYAAISLPDLQKLNISHNPNLQQVALKCSQLTHANLDHNPSLTRIALGRRIPYFKNLNISYCENITDAALTDTLDIDDFHEPFVLTTKADIPYLKIQGCHKIRSTVFHLISAYTSNEFPRRTLETWKRHAKLFDCYLHGRTFNFGQEEFTNGKMAIIIALLSKNLNLWEIDFTNNPIGDDTVYSLLDALRTHPTLRVLKIKLNDLTIIHPSVVAILKSNCILTTFTINGIESIVFRKTLDKQQINLTLTGIFDNAMFVFAALLKTNSVLKFLRFSGNRLNENNTALFCNGLQDNTCLEILDLRNCNIHDDDATQLLTVFQNNTTLQLINIDDNPCAEKIKCDIMALGVEHCKKNNNYIILQYYLQAWLPNKTIANETIDFVSDNPYALLEWQKVIDCLSRNIKEIKWLKCAFPVRDDLSVNSSSSSRSEASPAPEPSCLAALQQHSSAVVTLTQLTDGRLASGSYDKTIKIWDIKENRCRGTLNGHSSAIRIVILLSDGKLASGSDDKTIKIWDLGKKHCLTLTEHSCSVIALTQLKDGMLASGSADCSIKIWDVKQNCCIATLIEHTSAVYALIQLTDGRLVSGSLDKSIKIWDVKQYRCLATLEGHSNAVRTLIQLTDSRLASGSADKSIKIWDLKENNCLITLQGHSGGIMALTQLGDGRLASGSADKSIKIWDVNENYCLITLQGNSLCVFDITQLADGRLASGSYDKSIKIWDIAPSLVCYFDLSFRSTLQYLFSLRKNQLFIFVSLLPQWDPSEKVIHSLQSLQSFVQGLLYNCYARNQSLFFIKINIDENETSLNIACPNENLATPLYDCLNAFFYSFTSLRAFRELLDLTDPQQQSQREGKMPESPVLHHRQSSLAAPPPRPASPYNRYSFHVPIPPVGGPPPRPAGSSSYPGGCPPPRPGGEPPPRPAGPPPPRHSLDKWQP